MAPNVVLDAILQMLDKAIDMDTGTYSEISDSILYIIRLAIRVESYLLFLVSNHRHHKKNKSQYSGAYDEAIIRGLECNEDTIEKAMVCQSDLRHILDDKVFKIIARWIKRCKQKGRMKDACMLHAHLSLIYSNITPDELDARTVFTMLACQIFLFNNYKYDLDIVGPAKERSKLEENINNDLIIPQVELFDMFQRNRCKILNWLKSNPELRNIVMDGIVQLVEEGNNVDFDNSNNEMHVEKNWISIEQKGLHFGGRYVPENEYDPSRFDNGLSQESLINFEAWLREITTLAVNTEINVQLGEFTIKKNLTMPLEEEFMKMSEFKYVFDTGGNHSDIIQCAEVLNTTNRKWVRLVGMGNDLQLWTPDTRVPMIDATKKYEACKEEWLLNILEPWRNIVLPDIPLFLTTDSITFANKVLLSGYVQIPSEKNAEGTYLFIYLSIYLVIYLVFLSSILLTFSILISLSIYLSN
jgi:hypothetical protein